MEKPPIRRANTTALPIDDRPEVHRTGGVPGGTSSISLEQDKEIRERERSMQIEQNKPAASKRKPATAGHPELTGEHESETADDGGRTPRSTKGNATRRIRTDN
ncbi:MAG: hypothetical protein U0Q11_03725 [Vicinamibacterales bacterium]